MTRPSWEISGIGDLISALYALADSGYWSKSETGAWADRIIAAVEAPQYWLIDLSWRASSDVPTCDLVVFDHVDWLEANFPDDLADMTAGLVLLKFDAGRLSEEAARHKVGDLADGGYVTGIEIEEMWDIPLDDVRLNLLRRLGREVLASVDVDRICSVHAELVSSAHLQPF
ncbi:hypothetical protein [uncultured Roseibium sp.]|uniref:hypothetical protein n=1 Tax=uncultured Roseibium sp. TaxID=1936171 RepID=UPI003217D1A2